MVKVSRQYQKSSSFRKVVKRTPGGTLKTRAKRRKKKEKSRCEICSAPIKVGGIDRRAMYGKVCGTCMSRLVVLKTKIMEGTPIESVDLRYREYLKRIK